MNKFQIILFISDVTHVLTLDENNNLPRFDIQCLPSIQNKLSDMNNQHFSHSTQSHIIPSNQSYSRDDFEKYLIDIIKCMHNYSIVLMYELPSEWNSNSFHQFCIRTLYSLLRSSIQYIKISIIEKNYSVYQNLVHIFNYWFSNS